MVTSADALERYMLELINAERAAVGRAPLQLEQHLNQSAEDHSEWMLAADRFSHTGAGGSSAGDRMRDAGFDFSNGWAWGENIGYQSERGDPGLFDDVADIHGRLMNSSGHRANILSSNYDYVGLGIELDEFNGYTVVMVTQNFARTGGDVLLDTGGGGPLPPPPDPDPVFDFTPPPPDTPHRVTGTSGDDRLNGTSDMDEIFGYGGNDLLRGRAGDDTLYGGDGNDILRGQGGGDELVGGAGFDRADYKGSSAAVRADLGNPGSNSGAAAGDTYASIEWLFGSSHGDALVGDGNANQIWGGKGHDRIYGMKGDDILRGGPGHDKIHGQTGNDTLYGNGGDDDFVFNTGGGWDVVKDFQNNRDELDFTGFNFSSQSELFARASQVGDDVLFAFSDANRVTVEDMTIAQLQDDVLI